MVRTCLLISDDPDDHIEFSEALYEISDDIVLMTVADLNRAVDLLAFKKCVPDFILVNLAMGDFKPDVFFAILDEPELKNVRVIAYGDTPAQIARHRFSAFVDGDFSYSQLRELLEKIIMGSG